MCNPVQLGLKKNKKQKNIKKTGKPTSIDAVGRAQFAFQRNFSLNYFKLEWHESNHLLLIMLRVNFPNYMLIWTLSNTN